MRLIRAGGWGRRETDIKMHTYRYDVVSPVVYPEQLRGDDVEHPLPLVLGQRLVRPQGRHDVLHGLPVVPVA